MWKHLSSSVQANSNAIRSLQHQASYFGRPSFLQKRHFAVRHKVVELSDAVNVVKDRDTLVISGFVAQSSPEALLRALGERYAKERDPSNLRVLFGGGPGDYATRGINHLALPGLIETSIGGHYGQVPKLGQFVLDNHCAGYQIPMGAVSRLVRATASKSPGYITKVGLSTFVDPINGGGALNAKARAHPIVERISLDGDNYLRYFSFPINVAFIRGTTADPEGNLSMEEESTLGDAKNMAMATRSSGGLVVAQVMRLAETGSIPSRSVSIPGALVDCVVVCENPDEHDVSYFHKGTNPVWSGRLRQPAENIPPLPMSPRKIVARRAAMELKPNDVVNLGIGMPDGVASVAHEEGVFKYITLTTEPGTVGGIGVGGHNFGPAINAQAFNEMSQQFDLYNGGGLSIAFLGLAECGSKGDVNVSRFAEDSLIGPGGFIDIAGCTHRVNFCGTFSKKGAKVKVKRGEVRKDGSREPAKLVIEREGDLHTFCDKVREVTFSAKEAIASGQRVSYITERAVFQLRPDGIKLVEIAPGVDLEKDILAHMPVQPMYTLPIPLMDQRIFEEEHMDLHSDLFDMSKAVHQRVSYDRETNVTFLDLQNYVVQSQEEIDEFGKFFDAKLASYMEINGGKKTNVVVNYDGFDCKSQLTAAWTAMAQELQKKYYAKTTRYTGHVFMRKKISTELSCKSDSRFWKQTNENAKGKAKGVFTRADLVKLLKTEFFLAHDTDLIEYLMEEKFELTESEFPALMGRLRNYRLTMRIPKKTNGTKGNEEKKESDDK